MAEMISGNVAHNGFEDEIEDPPVKPLTHEQALVFRARHPQLSPWRVIAEQAAVGGAVVVLAWLLSGRPSVVWSALYGAATALLPGVLMARGMTSRLSTVTVGASAVSVMLWTLVKIGVSIAMLMLAPKLLQPVSWPALLAAMVLCMQVYWVALLWRGRRS